MIKYGLIMFFLTGTWFVLAQSDTSELLFDFYNPSIRLYSLGEAHTENDLELQMKVFQYVLSNTNIDAFVFELPQEVGKIINEYVLYGKRKEDMEVFLSYLKQTKDKQRIFIDSLRAHNIRSPHKISVVGIDDFGFSKLYRSLNALQIIFPELKCLSNNKIRKYILKYKKQNYSRMKRIEIIDNLKHDYIQYESEYTNCLGERSKLYYEQLVQLSTRYTLDWVAYDQQREIFMSAKLLQIINSNKVSFMICGGIHAFKSKDDEWYYGYPITSMTYTASEKYPGEVFSIVTQYYEKKKPIRIFPEFNLLSCSNSSYFQDKNIQYKVIKGEELKKHPEAVKRCDMVIIQNDRYKKRKKNNRNQNSR